MLQVVLYRPEIPPNTGNIMRLAANTGARLHLIRPLGFDLDDTKLRRAGLDYREWADVSVHDGFDDWLAAASPERIVAFTAHATVTYTAVEYRSSDALLFGPESDGLPGEIRSRAEISARVRIPMLADRRSLNLSNSVAIALYEALRQLEFPGMG